MQSSPNALSQTMNNSQQTPSAALDLQTVQAERLSTLGQLTAGVAHELNNPISFILSNLTSFQIYLEIFQRYFALYQQLSVAPPEQQAALRLQLQQLEQQEDLQFLLKDTAGLLQDSLDGAHRVRQLVLDLRRFTRPDQAQAELLSLQPLLETAIRLTHNEFKPRISLSRHFWPDEIWLLGQPAALTQLLVNLLHNACQAIGNKHGQVRVSSTVAEQVVCLTIEDDGPGVPGALKEQIFQPFFTTKAAGVGTGLGLSICRQIALAHHGELTVGDSALGGALFQLCLPTVTAPATD